MTKNRLLIFIILTLLLFGYSLRAATFNSETQREPGQRAVIRVVVN
jgi:hypothetical protein